MPALSHIPMPGDPLHCGADGCGKPWPYGCDDAKAELMREYRGDPMALLLYLGTWAVRVSRSHPWLSLHEIVRQYLGWLPGDAFMWKWPLNSSLPSAPPTENEARYGANAGRWSR